MAQPATASAQLRLDAAATTRLYSLDAFRGLTMVWMISEGFGLHVFEHHPVLGPFARNFEHAQWHGMYAWDLIQPFFMFIVGVAMPFAFAKREAAGETWSLQFRHVLRRCALLILLGLFARSVLAGRPVIDLINVLAQVSFTYFVAFLVLRSGWRVQAGTAFGLLAVHWALHQFSGLPDPWARNANIGWYWDQAVLGKNWGGGYATINCISSSFNTIFGVIAGNLLLRRRIGLITGLGLVFLVAGLALDPVVPLIKKIWTASFAIHSTGWCLLALAVFYYICDVRGSRRWARVFSIVGANSIFIYVTHEVLNNWFKRTAGVFVGGIGAWSYEWAQIAIACTAVAMQIYLCWWLYQRKIFFRV